MTKTIRKERKAMVMSLIAMIAAMLVLVGGFLVYRSFMSDSRQQLKTFEQQSTTYMNTEYDALSYLRRPISSNEYSVNNVAELISLSYTDGMTCSKTSSNLPLQCVLSSFGAEPMTPQYTHKIDLFTNDGPDDSSPTIKPLYNSQPELANSASLDSLSFIPSGPLSWIIAPIIMPELPHPQIILPYPSGYRPQYIIIDSRVVEGTQNMPAFGNANDASSGDAQAQK